MDLLDLLAQRRQRGVCAEAPCSAAHVCIAGPARRRSIRWVAEQLGHANPELILRVYAQ